MLARCVNCGQQYTRSTSFCANCGLSVSVPSSTLASDAVSTRTYENIYHDLQQRTSNRGASGSLRRYIACICGLAGLHGLSLVMGLNFDTLLDGLPILLLIAGITLAAASKVLFDLFYGYTLIRSFAEIIGYGIIVYLLVFGILWYFSPDAMRL